MARPDPHGSPPSGPAPSGPAPSGLRVGDVVEVDVTAVAHGGHMVARHAGQVLFVRHTLPGERVRAVVTETGAGQRFVRADAVDVLTPSPDRVAPPCPYAGPGRCGGCDLQHVSLERQRALKAEVVQEQLRRLAGLDVSVAVEPVPGGDLVDDGLRWRTRTEFAVGPDGRAGLRAHRSHDVIPVADCLISSERVVGTGALQRDWSGHHGVDVVAPSVGEPVVVALPVTGPVPPVRERALSRELTLSSRGFWQVHPGAAATFLETVMTMLHARPRERAVDLYAGVGLFAAGLAEAVGPAGQVVAVEADADATAHAQANLAAYGTCLVVRARVDDAFGVPRHARGRSRRRAPARSPLLPPSADVVVLDPPRVGAGPEVCAAIVALRPRAVAYVACDPAALGRDLKVLGEKGYRLEELRAFDAFPMTHHVECVALLTKTGSELR